MPVSKNQPNSDNLQRRVEIIRALENNRDTVEDLLADREDLVITARYFGVSWAKIGHALGKTHGVVREKYKRIVDEHQ